MEQRVGDNVGELNTPHHQRPFDNVFTYGYRDMPVQHSYQFHEGGYQGRPQVRGGRRGGLGGRGYYRPQEELPRHEACHEDNLYEDYGDNSNVGQAYHGGYYSNQQRDKTLDEIKWKVPSFKGRLIANPTRCFKCNGMGHIAINCPTKRTFVFSEDLNGWIEKIEDDYQEGNVDTEESSEDQEIVSFKADEEGMSLVTIRALSTQVHVEETSIQRENIFHTKKAIHYGMKNNYTFQKDEEKVMLNLLTTSQVFIE
ncbi:hypothetical protein M9H77_23254 [Catharanthus roseus]|uniref:Uncharacterized protein n=1 Tax=Catharanthus roseus TaxID=4058 RepID=A0ACC0AWU1_CATRO|nr:hypothetical protein M9H77_23254 [Catharanthus roseus]